MPRARRIHLSKWYYIFLYGTLIPACTAFFIAKEPLALVTMGTWLAAFAMAFYCPLLAYVNNRPLPEELRPKWYQTLCLLIGTAFYWGMILYSLSMGAILKRIDPKTEAQHIKPSQSPLEKTPSVLFLIQPLQIKLP